METAKDEKKSGFGLKEYENIFVAALKIATRNAALLCDRQHTVDGMTVEVKFISTGQKPSRKRRWWRRKRGVKYTISIMVHENGRVVFDASSQWKGNKKKRGWVRTFHEDLWTLRLMRAARNQDYWLSVYAEVYRKATRLLSEQAETCESLPSEMKLASEMNSSPTATVHRLFESEQIEVRGFEMDVPNKQGVRYKAVKVVHTGQEVYEAVYAQDLSTAQLPESPKLTTQFVKGDWQKTLQGLGEEKADQQ